MLPRMAAFPVDLQRLVEGDLADLRWSEMRLLGEGSGAWIQASRRGTRTRRRRGAGGHQRLAKVRPIGPKGISRS